MVFYIGFIDANDLISHFLLVFRVHDVHCSTKNNTIGFDRGRVDHLTTRNFILNFTNTALNHALAFFGRIIFSILTNITMSPCFFNRFNN